MTSFRSFLARERLVPVEQLDRALQRQILYGEDLSVNLLEMGAVDEDELAQFLGMFHRLPIVTRSDINSVPADITSRVPAEVAVRHRICPIAVADDAMVVAATRQLERTVLAELERLTGKTVSLTIASPLTLAWGLHVHYGAEMPSRYQRILERQPRKGKSIPPPSPAPGLPEPPDEEADQPRPRRASGIIVMPDDVPASELAAMQAEQPAAGTSTPEASLVPPVPVEPMAEVPPPLPLRSEFEAARVSSAADDVLRGVSLSHDNPADRLLEMVLGPPTDGQHPSQPPPSPSQAPPPAIDAAAAVLGTAPAEDSAAAAVIACAEPAGSAAMQAEAAGLDSASPAVSRPPTAPPRRPPTTPPPADAPGAVPTPVVRLQAVMLGTSDEPELRPARAAGVPSAVAALLAAPAAPVAAPPRTALINRIAKLDALASPTDVLRYSFQLFSAPFKVGLLFDTTSASPRLRDAFGVRTGVEGYRGRPQAAATLPPTVRNASQPLLCRVETEGPLADLLRELFGEPPVNALFLPITVGSRVVAVMYGDNRDALTTFENVRELFHLAWAAGTRLGDLVRRRHRAEPADGTTQSGLSGATEPGVPPPRLD